MRKLALLLLFAACGDDGVRHTPDAGPHDGPETPDATVDTAETAVAITVMQLGAPVAGVHVYFQNADSTLVLATTTDATGTASAVMAAGGYVTAIDPFVQPLLGGIRHNVETFAGVKPGDHLQLADGTPQPATIDVTIQAPFDPVASSYRVFSPCNADGTSLVAPAPTVVAAPATGAMSLFDCGATTDFLVVTYDANEQPVNYFFAANVAVADTQTIDLTGSTYVGTATRTLTFNNVPGPQSVAFEDDLIGPHGEIFASSNETPSDQTDPVVTESVPAFTGATSLVRTNLIVNLEQQTELDWGPYSDTFATDVGAHALVSYTDLPSYDVASHTASIPEGATGAVPDFSLAILNATRESDGASWGWIVAAPHGAGVVLPVLPTDVYDFNITATDAAGVLAWASGKVPGGYDAVRAFVLSLTDIEGFATSSSGTATLASFEQGTGRVRPLTAFKNTLIDASTRVRARRGR